MRRLTKAAVWTVMLALAGPSTALGAGPGIYGFEAQATRALAEVRQRPRFVKAAHRDGLLDQVNSALAHLVEEARPAVVQVWAIDPKGVPGDTGTGFFVDGLVLTNRHVVKPESQPVRVQFADGAEAPAQVLSSNQCKDVALLRTTRSMAGLRLGSTAGLRQGHMVMALGHPRGLPFSATLGVVSSVGLLVDELSVRMVQTDAALNPGSSGSPLLAMDGSVVGMGQGLSTESGGYEGIAFAVAAETLARLLEQYRRLGHIRPGYLGIDFFDGLPTGALISLVTPRSPAAGRLEVGDQLLAVGGRTLSRQGDQAVAEARSQITDHAPGETLALEFERRGQRLKLQVTLAEYPSAPCADR